MKKVIALILALAWSAGVLVAAEKSKDEPKTKMESGTFSGLEWRSIGPALVSGRIVDIAIHPDNRAIRYVAVASGGVWKTTNSGTTWTPIFD